MASGPPAAGVLGAADEVPVADADVEGPESAGLSDEQLEEEAEVPEEDVPDSLPHAASANTSRQSAQRMAAPRTIKAGARPKVPTKLATGTALLTSKPRALARGLFAGCA
ncbi:MAG: hypothetical protein KF696_07910 [Planctomycetes bacterium]|nr:hypothetical protein [Planctomycetota bacterium]MCW8135725.1 hypothetical protein [Planctomycetota bacterium]